MVWLSVAHPSRPPWRLGRIWLKLLGPTSNYFSPVVRIVDLLAGLHELDVGFGYNSAIRLLEVLEDLLIVTTQEIRVTEGDRSLLVADT